MKSKIFKTISILSLLSLIILINFANQSKATIVNYERNYNDDDAETRFLVNDNTYGDLENLRVDYSLAEGKCIIRGVKYKYNNVGTSSYYDVNILFVGDNENILYQDSYIPHVSSDSWRTFRCAGPIYLLDDDPQVHFIGTNPSNNCISICADSPSYEHSYYDVGSGWTLDTDFEYIVDLMYEPITLLPENTYYIGNLTTEDYVDAYFVELNSDKVYQFAINRTHGTGDFNLKLFGNQELTDNFLKETSSLSYPKHISYHPSDSGTYLLLVEANNAGVDIAEYSIIYSEQASLLWTFSKSQFGYSYWSSAAMGDVDGDGELEVIIGSEDGNAYALDGKDGNQIWNYTTGLGVYSSPALGDIDGDGELEVVIGSLDSNIYALNGKDGSQIWNYTTGDRVDSSSAALGDIDGDGELEVVIGSGDGNIYALNGKDGSQIWKCTTGDRVYSSPALGDVDGDGELEVVIGSDDGNIYALNGKDGSQIWKYTTGDRVYSSPALGDIDGDGELEVVIGSGDGNIYALNGKDGNQIWNYTTGDRVYSSPALGDIDGDGELEVVIGSFDSNIYALNGKDGSQIWKYTTGHRVWSSAALGDIDGDGELEVVIGSSDYNVYVINGKFGYEEWYYYLDYSIRLEINCPILYDLDDDYKLEIIMGNCVLDPVSKEWDAFYPPDDMLRHLVKWQGFSGDIFFHRTNNLEYSNRVPNLPTNPYPINKAFDTEIPTELSIEVSDPDYYDNLNVSFYDASNNVIIDKDIDVKNGNRALINWTGLSEKELYHWYVVITDGELIIKSPIYWFITVYSINISNNMELQFINLTTNADNPDSDGLFNLFWTSQIQADNYSIYMSSNIITELNESIIVLSSGLKKTNFTLQGFNDGDYYFIVQGFVSTGFFTSQCIHIIVDQPDISINFVRNLGISSIILAILSLVLTGISLYLLRKKSFQQRSDLQNRDDNIKNVPISTSQKFCVYCGNKLYENERFCGECGKERVL